MTYSKYIEYCRQVSRRVAHDLAIAAGVPLALVQIWDKEDIK